MILQKINNAFSNTQNSYKYYWWLSLIEISVLEQKKEISFEEVILKIISKMWFPVNFFKLSFGKLDQCSRYIKQIQGDYQLNDNITEKELYKFLLEHKSSELLIKISSELTRYVPYRFIRPWYEEETRGLKDSLVNRKILEIQGSAGPYIIDFDLKKLIIPESWFSWLNLNYKLVQSYTYFELIKYLEKENPYVSGITKKIERPRYRSVARATKYWTAFISHRPLLLDVFERKHLIDIDEISIDHFLPWSFTTHDLLWNLHPVNKSINSSKNNLLPSENYLESFTKLQYEFCRFLSLEKKEAALIDYYTLFGCSKEELTTITQTRFINKLNNHYLPQYEVAKNMGFGQNWSLI